MDQPVETWTVRVDADLGNFESEMEAAAGSGKKFGKAMTTAFQGVVIEGKSVTDSVRMLALSLSKLTLQAAFKPVEDAIGGFINSLIGGGFSFGGGAGGGGRNVSVTFNVTTPDPDSFRRTEAQISAMLARAVSQGQRNL